VHEFGTPEYEERLPPGVRRPGLRSVVVVDIRKVSTSCDFGIPLYNFVSHHSTLFEFAATLESRNREFETADGEAGPKSETPPASDKGLKAY